MLTSTRAFPADCSRVQMYSPPPTIPKQSLRDHRQHIPVLATSGPEANAFKPRHLCHSHQGWLQSFYHACLPFDTEPLHCTVYPSSTWIRVHHSRHVQEPNKLPKSSHTVLQHQNANVFSIRVTNAPALVPVPKHINTLCGGRQLNKLNLCLTVITPLNDHISKQ